MVTFSVPGEPVAKARPRLNRKTGVVYTPARTKSYETLVREIASDFFDAPLDGPITIVIEFLFPRPKNKVWKKKPMPREWKTTKPDIDNLYKSTIDALNGIAFRDDSQICCVLMRKYIAAGDEVPRTLISIQQGGEL